MRGSLNIRGVRALEHGRIGHAWGGSGRRSPPPGNRDPGVSPRKTFWNWNVRRRIFTHTKGNTL